jgi:hypothetical protein
LGRHSHHHRTWRQVADYDRVRPDDAVVTHRDSTENACPDAHVYSIADDRLAIRLVHTQQAEGRVVPDVNIVADGARAEPCPRGARYAHEETFGVTVEEREMLPENLDSIEGIANFIARKKD